jgi:hypothetical protein
MFMFLLDNNVVTISCKWNSFKKKSSCLCYAVHFIMQWILAWESNSYANKLSWLPTSPWKQRPISWRARIKCAIIGMVPLQCRPPTSGIMRFPSHVCVSYPLSLDTPLIALARPLINLG